ncbi:hydantoinase/oxoprolinase family protein [Clostridium botulinum]|nr:hydantoinase/oxoprolinase family protein [Clostridium botulinum]NFP00859.1 hydantoinase/oxoprolinase family protein [Clostridium botulinum]NFT92774.1 hydantoinase/oxoprolinase family protein [Clostridium botulinum]
MIENRKVRVGIDVGGTHTKAVAIDNHTYKIIGKSSVKTTHDSKLGVATGVVKAFQNCLKENNINAEDVVFVAHSTTQATNALLEGDVAHVGIIGIVSGGIEGFLARKQVVLKDINLGTGRIIKVSNKIIKKKELNRDNIINKISELKNLGVEVFVVSMAFGVDDMTEELLVAEVIKEMGMPVTIASNITKLYGLTRRTKTAAINASILPKMLDTANSTEESVHKAGVNVPLMIMRGDGGAMDISEMKKRPILTMLSGPAASVMGSLMYLRVSNGIYFEVGGTSTNIGVIKNGRPVIDYSMVDGHKTYVSSLDVQVLGVAGGSMVRASCEKIIDVGPRSAHIAGMDYSVFTSEEEIIEPTLEFFAPKEGDIADYVAIKLKNGKRITITNSCAANVLGLIKPHEFSYGIINSARKAMEPLAKHLGKTIEEVANEILKKSFEKIEPVILELIEKYKLDNSQISLIGVGGGASSLIGYCANKMNLKYSIPRNAEVISSIGVALAMVRDVIERIVPNPTPTDIRNIRTEVINKAIKSGASAETIDVHIEIDANTSRLIAIATGSTEVKSTDLLKECTELEAKNLACDDMGILLIETNLLEKNKYFYIFSGEVKNKNHIRIVDKKGFIKVQRNDGIAYKIKAKDYGSIINKMWEELTIYKSDSVLRPDFYLCVGPRVMDFASGGDFKQMLMLMDVTVQLVDPEEEIIVIGAKNEI